MPANIIHIRTGLTLNDMQNVGMSLTSILSLVVLGFVALIPTFLKKRYAKNDKFE